MTSAVICQADFNYYVPAIQDVKEVTQSVHNGRQFENPGWEVCGFDLKQHHSAVTDWTDDDEIKRIHYSEIADFAAELTGCDHALVASHILRNPEQAKVHEDLAPIQFVHSDFAESYGKRMQEFYAGDSEEAQVSLAKEDISPDDVARARRMVILQFWRNVGPSRMDLPIAFCDARSVGSQEVVPTPVENYAGGGFNFETLAVLGPEDGHHRWYTFPEMGIDEVVAFRTYDSEMIANGEPFWTPHSAFRDPEVASGEPSRYSIELRATCLFK